MRGSRRAGQARVVHERQRIETSDQQGTNLVVPDITNTQTARDSLALRSTDQSVSAIGILTGLNLVYRERYIVDLLFRRDGSSLFGANDRWANYARGSVAWRLTQEPWWPAPAVSDLKLRASLGTAGGRPRFDAQYESYSIASGGVLSANTLGNKNLEPELTTELELGVDGELFRRVGVNVTYAHAITTKQLLLVPPSLSSGFSNQWQNAGTLDNKTWEASLNLPIVSRRNLTWSARLNYDRNRPVVTALAVPPFASCPGDYPRGCAPGSTTMFFTQSGGRVGTIYGSKFITSCRELPAEFASQCGPGQEWQRNDEGLIVWIGKGYTPGRRHHAQPLAGRTIRLCQSCHRRQDRRPERWSGGVHDCRRQSQRTERRVECLGQCHAAPRFDRRIGVRPAREHAARLPHVDGADPHVPSLLGVRAPRCLARE